MHRTRPRRSVVFFFGVALPALAGCGAGPYGYSRTYAPLDAEKSAAAGAEDYDPVMSRRQPEAWRSKKVSVFGVVEGREDRGGFAYLRLSVRVLEDRNACETSEEDSCRTTVSDREYDKVHAQLALSRPADAQGPESVGVGSLVRVVGTVAAPDRNDSIQVLAARYYRHWPRGYWRTASARSVLRR